MDGKIWTAGLTDSMVLSRTAVPFRYHNPNNKSLKQLGIRQSIHFFVTVREPCGWELWKMVLQFKRKRFHCYIFQVSDEAGAPANFITRLIETIWQQLWALSLDGLHLLSAQKAFFKHSGIQGQQTSCWRELFYRWFFDAAMNCIWIGSFGGGWFNSIYQPINSFIMILSTKNLIQNSINAIAPKSATELWICNGNLSVYNKSHIQSAMKSFRMQVMNTVLNTGVGRMVTDKEGNIWFCSFNWNQHVALAKQPMANNLAARDQNNNNTILEPTNVCKLGDKGTDDCNIGINRSWLLQSG